MSGYSHWNWVCPYYKWDKKLDLHCEAGILKFKAGNQKRDYAVRYCCNLVDWERCSLAAALSHFYEKGNGNEQESGRTSEATDKAAASKK